MLAKDAKLRRPSWVRLAPKTKSVQCFMRYFAESAARQTGEISLFWLQLLSRPLEVSVSQVLQRRHLVDWRVWNLLQWSLNRAETVFFKLSLDSGTWGDNKGWYSTWAVLSGSCCLLQMVDGALRQVLLVLSSAGGFHTGPRGLFIHPLTCSPTHGSFNFDRLFERVAPQQVKLKHRSHASFYLMLLLVWANPMCM